MTLPALITAARTVLGAAFCFSPVALIWAAHLGVF